jgi:thiol:disulfide interchange protein DsbC
MLIINRFFTQVLSMMIALGFSFPLFADADEDIKSIRAAVSTILSSPPDSIMPTPMVGLYEVVAGGSIFYSSADGKFLLTGELIDINGRVNLTQLQKDKNNIKILAGIEDDGLIIYPAKGEEKYRVTVFTDIDCGYCRRLHSGMDEMNNAGITVRYLAYPRAGVGSASYDKIVGAWCADDPQKALTDAKINSKFSSEKCDNPVKEHLALGEQLGVNGTPAVFMDNGSKIGGYLAPQALLAALKSNSQ